MHQTKELEACLAEMVEIYWGKGDGHEPPPVCIQKAQALLRLAKDGDEILASLEKEISIICHHELASHVEQRLANALACLIAMIRHERAVQY